MVSPPVVCGVDGSEQSRRAFREAVRLARALDARLDVIMAWEASTSMYDAYFPDPGRAPKVVALGILDLDQTTGFLDWRGIVVTFVRKQTPFVALLVSGAMASLDRSTIEAARNLGASRLRILVEILVPQVMPTLVVGLILSFVTMMSVLSVPLMISGESPTMMTVDMAFRINNYGDYGTANALGFISYLMTAACAWFYLKRSIK